MISKYKPWTNALIRFKILMLFFSILFPLCEQQLIVSPLVINTIVIADLQLILISRFQDEKKVRLFFVLFFFKTYME